MKEIDYVKELGLKEMEIKTKEVLITELEQELNYQKQARSIAENAVVDLTKENADLKARLNAINVLIPELEKQSKAKKQQLAKAREIILKLHNTGRDVLMCRAEEKAYDNLSNAISDKSIEQFLKEVEK